MRFSPHHSPPLWLGYFNKIPFPSSFLGQNSSLQMLCSQSAQINDLLQVPAQQMGLHKLLAPPIGEKGKLYRICGLV